mmetsp:Transcript_60953/g.132209  ORF Transcript_60953/g.132209 Transcript_60953/m.132209 type:complete len:96 (+) Transcript_60953:36-323(+)
MSDEPGQGEARLLSVGAGVEVDVNDEADTFWIAFEEYITEVLPEPVAGDFRKKFLDSHYSMFKKLNLEQLEGIAEGICRLLMEQELGEDDGESKA